MIAGLVALVFSAVAVVIAAWCAHDSSKHADRAEAAARDAERSLQTIKDLQR